MASAHNPVELFEPLLVFLGAGVVAVPLFQRLKLGAVLGYLAAGVMIGPQVLSLVDQPALISQIAELGIVMFLFVIGLEMKPSRVWSMRRDIFGLGGAQLVVTAMLVMLLPLMFRGGSWQVALVIGLGLAISSTAIMMQVLEEHGEVHSPHGERSFAVALFQDLAIVPMLALVAALSPIKDVAADVWWLTLLKSVGAVGLVSIIGLYGLNPFFRFLARWGAREIMVAAALLVVTGAALIMAVAGLSMAMGAFLAGVFLAESHFRHQLEADIEPFRGILMGLFFMTVGMTIDLAIVQQFWQTILMLVVAVGTLKALAMYAVMRVFQHDHDQSVRVALILAQSGEFGFVLFSAAVASGIMSPTQSSIAAAVVVVSMAINPFLYRLAPLLSRKAAKPEAADFSDARGEVLVIGFGRFGQLASQILVADSVTVTTIDNDVEMIQGAARFGFKVYYGDGTRLDVLRAAGAGRARMIAICVDKADVASKIVTLVKAEFPFAKVFVRAFDRRHAISLRQAGVDFELRETVESALRFGQTMLTSLNGDEERSAEIMQDIRRRDEERLELQAAEGEQAGRHLLRTDPVKAEPLTPVTREGRALNADAEDVLSDTTRYSG